MVAINIGQDDSVSLVTTFVDRRRRWLIRELAGFDDAVADVDQLAMFGLG